VVLGWVALALAWSALALSGYWLWVGLLTLVFNDAGKHGKKIITCLFNRQQASLRQLPVVFWALFLKLPVRSV
jgi:hypothetical protein